jgi:hypothetical protein
VKFGQSIPKQGQKLSWFIGSFLRQLLGVRKSTTNHTVLAEFGRFLLQFHLWQHILYYHDQLRAPPPHSWLNKLALLEGSQRVALLTELKHFQVSGDLMCAGLLTRMDNISFMMSLIFHYFGAGESA